MDLKKFVQDARLQARSELSTLLSQAVSGDTKALAYDNTSKVVLQLLDALDTVEKHL